MIGISIREFARRDGCADSLVRRAIAGGYIERLADGSLDPGLVGTGWRKTNRRAHGAAHGRAHTADKSLRLGRKVRTPGAGAIVEAPATVDDGADDVGEEVLLSRLLAGNVGLEHAERIKANAQALRVMLAARQSAGELVETSLAERVMFDEARRRRDAWLNWPSRVGPLLAADLDRPVDQIVTILAEQVYQQVAELGEPEDAFDGVEAGEPAR